MNNNEVSKVNKEISYPYIDQLVDTLDLLKLKDYINNNEDDNINIFLSFMILYIKVCNILKNKSIELSNENIKYFMALYFKKTHLLDIITKLKNIKLNKLITQ